MELPRRIQTGLDFMWVALIKTLQQEQPKTIHVPISGDIQLVADVWRLLSMPKGDLLEGFLQFLNLFYKLDLKWEPGFSMIPPNSIIKHWSKFLTKESQEMLTPNIPHSLDYLRKISYPEAYVWNVLHYLAVADKEMNKGQPAYHASLLWLSQDRLIFFMACGVCKIHFAKNSSIRRKFSHLLNRAATTINLDQRKHEMFIATCIFHDDINKTIYPTRPLNTNQYETWFNEYKTVQETPANELAIFSL